MLTQREALLIVSALALAAFGPLVVAHGWTTAGWKGVGLVLGGGGLGVIAMAFYNVLMRRRA